MPRQTWVHLLVWRPSDPTRPLDVTQSWPSVLQISRDGTPAPPGVILRPGEPVLAATRRIATALQLEPPFLPRVLAVDQHPAEEGHLEQLSLILDGGWLTADAPLTCDCGDHAWVWSPVADLGRVALVHALRTLVTGHPPAVLWRGMPTLPAHDPSAHEAAAYDPSAHEAAAYASPAHEAAAYDPCVRDGSSRDPDLD